MSELSTAAHIDFETFSLVELESAGVDAYAEDTAKTGVWCMQWCIGDGAINNWVPGDADPTALLAHIAAGGAVVAHNAYFELTIWNDLVRAKQTPHQQMPLHWRTRPSAEHWPELKIEQLHCTMAMASSLALPASLDQLAPELGMEECKDKEGRALMLRMMRPRSNKDGVVAWWDGDAEKVKRLHEYCRQDVVVERDACGRMFNLTPSERDLWMLHMRINKRGIKIDVPTVTKSMRYVELKKAELSVELAKLTGKAVTAVTQNAKIAEWLDLNGIPGCRSVAKDQVKEMLTREDLPKTTKRVLEIKQLSGGAATSKLPAMLAAASSDERARGTFGFHSASTGRFSSYRIQLHNFFRPLYSYETVEHIIDALTGNEADAILELCYNSPLDCVSSALRSLLIADKGKDLIAADFNNIEGRMLAWIAGEEWKLKVFREFDAGTGPDVYKITAANILSMILGRQITPKDVDSFQRQSYGKVPELALGFGGGYPAFRDMGRTYNVKVLEEFDDPREGWLSFDDVEAIKDAWRAKHPKTTQLWWGLENAAIDAVRKPGQIFAVANGKVRYMVHKQFLFCRLPSGRKLAYFKPHLIQEQRVSRKTGETYNKTVLTYSGMDSITRQFRRQYAKVSVHVENVISGTARDVLGNAMKRVEKHGYPVVLHVHDEAVAEIDKGFGSLPEYERLMCANDPWNEGLPINAKGAWRGYRYRKD